MNASESPGAAPGTTLTRRRLLGACGAAAVGAVAGCVSRDPDSDQPDLVLKNCTGDPVTLSVSVTGPSGETVHDEDHEVSGDACSDIGPSQEVDGVWTDPGEYRIEADADGFDAVGSTVDASQSAIEGETFTRTIRLDDGVIEIP